VLELFRGVLCTPHTIANKTHTTCPNLSFIRGGALVGASQMNDSPFLIRFASVVAIQQEHDVWRRRASP